MTSIDGWLYAKIYDPVAHQCEARGWATRYTLSRYATIPYGAWSLMPLWNAKVDGAVVGFVTLGIVNVLLGLWNAYVAEQMVGRPGLANIHRHAGIWQFARGFWIGVVALDTFRLLSTQDFSYVPALCASVGYASHVFFLGCSEMPPSLPREIAERAAERSGKLATVEG